MAYDIAPSIEMYYHHKSQNERMRQWKYEWRQEQLQDIRDEEANRDRYLTDHERKLKQLVNFI